MAEMAIVDVSELREWGLGKCGHTSPQAVSLFSPELGAELCSYCGGREAESEIKRIYGFQALAPYLRSCGITENNNLRDVGWWKTHYSLFSTQTLTVMGRSLPTNVAHFLHRLLWRNHPLCWTEIWLHAGSIERSLLFPSSHILAAAFTLWEVLQNPSRCHIPMSLLFFQPNSLISFNSSSWVLKSQPARSSPYKFLFAVAFSKSIPWLTIPLAQIYFCLEFCVYAYTCVPSCQKILVCVCVCWEG